MQKNLLFSIHEDHLTIGVLTVFFLFTSGLLNSDSGRVDKTVL
jgi:hypothetical protein